MVLEAEPNAAQGQSPSIRTVAVKGLAGYKIDTITKFNELQGHAPNIIRIIMKTIGDGEFLDSDLNFHALSTLKAMLKVVPNNVLLSWPTEIVSKITPFFNLCEKMDAAAAIAVFGQLSIFMTHLSPNDLISDNSVQETKELFSELIHQLIVQLLLHLNNEDSGEIKKEIREASKVTLVQVFKFLGPNYDKLSQTHLETAKKLNYSEFLKDFAKIPDEMFHSYIDKTMVYFLLGDARLRANAVHLVTNLVVENAAQCDNGEKVCQELAKLLCDSSNEVKIAAASNLGKVCLAVTKN